MIFSWVYEYHGFSSFIDDFDAVNYDIEFITSFKNIYSKELGLKVEYQKNLASFLDIDIKIEDVIELFSYTNSLTKEKKFHSLWSEFPTYHTICHLQIVIARSNLKINHFVSRASYLFLWMKTRRRNRATLTE